MSCISLKGFPLGVALVCLLAAPAVAAQITYQEVTVGNPGNANDTGGGAIGAVAYSYQIGKFDVTIGQYSAFLNAADPNGTNPNGIYNSSMGTDLNSAGISYNPASSTGSKYSVMDNGGDSGPRPITYVSWFDAARFANWMTNGQGSGSTETGAYDLANAAAGVAPAKTPGAAFYIPDQNQWYKAAYYDPTLNGGTGGYYTYATQSNSAPGNTIGSDPNQANYIAGGNYSVTQSSSYDGNQNYLTAVGAFSRSASFYGTFDQSGNVNQWNDLDGTTGSSRGLRGGDWNYTASSVSSSYSCSTSPSYESYYAGFRLASPVSRPVPEIDPAGMGSVLALLTGAFGLLERRRLKANLAS